MDQLILGFIYILANMQRLGVKVNIISEGMEPSIVEITLKDGTEKKYNFKKESDPPELIEEINRLMNEKVIDLSMR